MGKSKIGFEIYPAPNISTCIVEPYNAMPSTHWLLDHTEVSVLLDNEAIYGICQKQLDIDRPSYLHFMTTALAPVINAKKASHEAQTIREITDHVFQPQNMLVKYVDFDPVEDKYMAISVNKIAFVEWCPTGFKIGLNEVPAATLM